MSGRRVLSWLVATALLIAVRQQVARGDAGSLGAVGYGVVPLDSDQIAMVAERVEAEILDDQAWVTCVFTFTNTGPATQVLMGFPQAQRDALNSDPVLRDFRAAVDGQQVVVTFRPNAQPEGDWDYAGWHTFAVDFAAGQTRVVQNTYHGRLGWGAEGGRTFEYVLHTGAGWHGSIGQAEVIVRWQRDRDVVPETILARPGGYVSGDRELTWRFTDLEPTREEDIQVGFRPLYGPHNIGAATASSGNIHPSETGYMHPAALFSDGDPTTAWRSAETAGVWMAWSYTGYAHYATPTLGLGILSGPAGDEFRAHGRPKEVLVRLAQLKKGAEMLPVVIPVQESFVDPVPYLEITEHRLILEDAPHWQFLRLEHPTLVLAFQIVVQSVYPGERHEDVSIAEVLFPLLEQDLASPPPFLPVTGGSPAAWQPIWTAAIAGLALICLGWLWRCKRILRRKH